MRPCFHALVVVLLTACAAPARGPDSPYFQIPEGSTAVLEQPVTIPSPGVSVWIQDGEVGSGHDRWHAACKLEMRTRPDERREIAPDTFRITRVAHGELQVSLDDGLRHVTTDIDEGGPTAYEMQTFLFLASERQPDVYRLVCAHWDGPAFPHHLTFNEIRDTLQGIFRLELP